MPIDLGLIILFIVVGGIVSLDVTGLTLSKSKYFFENPKTLSAWALSNAIWHAGLLLVYILAISGLVSFVPDFLFGIIDGIKWLASQIPLIDIAYVRFVSLVGSSLAIHAPVIVGLAALLILWMTYSQKIVSRPSAGNISELSSLARLVFNLVDLLIRFLPGKRFSETELVRILYWQAQAALVAVDMLALATLLKSMRVLESWVSSVLVCVIVFICVFSLAILAGLFGSKSYETLNSNGSDGEGLKDAQNWILVTIRLAEPYLIFYFALQLISYLIFGEQVHSVTFFFASALLVVALVSTHSLPKVVSASLSPAPQFGTSAIALRSVGAVILDSLLVLRVLCKWVLWFGLGVLGFALFLYFKSLLGFLSSQATSISFEAEISHLLGILKVVASVLILFNIERFRRIEDGMVNMTEIVVKNCYAFVFVILALFMASMFPMIDQLLSRASSIDISKLGSQLGSLGLVENHRHVLQLGLWLLYLLLLGGVFSVANSRWSLEIIRVESKGTEYKSHFWRPIFVSIYVVAAFLLSLIGYLQAKIAN